MAFVARTPGEAVGVQLGAPDLIRQVLVD